MKIWVEDQALIRRRRHLELQRLDAWLLAHPRASNWIAIALGIVIFGLSQLLAVALDAIARRLS